MAGGKRNADMAIGLTDELSEAYGAEGRGEIRENEGAGLGAGEGYGHGYGHGHRHGNGSGDEDGYGVLDVDEDVIKYEQAIRQAEKGTDEGKGMIEERPPFNSC